MTFGDPEISVGLISPPDRPGLVADIMIDAEQFAEIRIVDGSAVSEIYGRRDGESWELSPERVCAALVEAIERLHASD